MAIPVNKGFSNLPKEPQGEPQDSNNPANRAPGATSLPPMPPRSQQSPVQQSPVQHQATSRQSSAPQQVPPTGLPPMPRNTRVPAPKPQKPLSRPQNQQMGNHPTQGVKTPQTPVQGRTEGVLPQGLPPMPRQGVQQPPHGLPSRPQRPNLPAPSNMPEDGLPERPFHGNDAPVGGTLPPQRREPVQAQRQQTATPRKQSTPPVETDAGKPGQRVLRQSGDFKEASLRDVKKIYDKVKDVNVQPKSADVVQPTETAPPVDYYITEPVYKTDPRTGKTYEEMPRSRYGASGTPIIQVMMSDDLESEAERFLGHLRVPPSQTELREAAEERKRIAREHMENYKRAAREQEQIEAEARKTFLGRKSK